MSARISEASERFLSLEEYENLPEEEDHLLELVRGRLVREPRPGAMHGWLARRLFRALDRYVDEHSLGLVIFETGFLLSEDPPTVRGPDVAFIASENLPRRIPEGFWERSPDLAIEVLSPSNTAAEIREKVLEYLAAGSRLVWIIYPGNRTVTVYRSPEDLHILKEGEALDGADIVPGFQLPLSKLFEPPSDASTRG